MQCSLLEYIEYRTEIKRHNALQKIKDNLEKNRLLVLM